MQPDALRVGLVEPDSHRSAGAHRNSTPRRTRAAAARAAAAGAANVFVDESVLRRRHPRQSPVQRSRRHVSQAPHPPRTPTFDDTTVVVRIGGIATHVIIIRIVGAAATIVFVIVAVVFCCSSGWSQHDDDLRSWWYGGAATDDDDGGRCNWGCAIAAATYNSSPHTKYKNVGGSQN